MSKMALYGDLASYVKYIPELDIGFNLPLFKCDDSDVRYVQIVNDFDGTIKYFARLDETVESTPIPLPLIRLNSGEPQAYVFTDYSKRIIAGQLNTIKHLLRDMMQSTDIPAGIGLKIAELVGFDRERGKFRRLTIKKIQGLSLGEKTSRALKRSFRFQDRLKLKHSKFPNLGNSLIFSAPIIQEAPSMIQEAPSMIQEAPSMIQEAPRALEFWRGKDDFLVEETLPQPNFRVQRFARVPILRMPVTSRESQLEYIFAGPWRKGKSQVIAKDAGFQFIQLRTIFWYREFDLLDTLLEETAFELSAKIIMARNQEERIAILLSYAAYKQPCWHLAIRSYYHDRGQFARNAIGIARRDLIGVDKYAAPDLHLVRTIDMIYKSAILNVKGRFLLAVAKYMGGLEVVREYINSRLRNTQSFSVVSYQKEISNYLG
jgi:hypothetical protein